MVEGSGAAVELDDAVDPALRHDVRIVVIPFLAWQGVEARMAVGVRRIMPTVMVDRRLDVVVHVGEIARQSILLAHDDRLVKSSENRRSGNGTLALRRHSRRGR